MSIISETLKKLEKKREGREMPLVIRKDTRRKSKLLRPLLFMAVGIAACVTVVLFFLNEYSLNNQLKTYRENALLTEDIVLPVVKQAKPAEESVQEKPDVTTEVEKPVAAEPISNAQETVHKDEGIKPEKVKMPPRMELGGVIVGQGDPFAIINGRLYGVGEEIESAKILSIDKNSVTYLFNDREYTLRIR